MSSVDYVAALLKSHDDVEHAGVKGMKWGVRKDRGAPKEIVAPSKGKASETSAQKYVRLTTHAKQHGANSLDDDDLKFVTQRGNAIAQVNRLNERKPGWVADLAKQALKQAAQKKLNVAIEEAQKKVAR